MSLYCPKCRKWAYKNHKCSIFSLIPTTRDARPLVDKLFNLGFDLLSIACLTHPVQGSLYEHTIIVDIEFKRQYISTILGDLPVGWKYYLETVTDDHWPISALAYGETYVWFGFETIEERIEQIVAGFVEYLDTRDKEALGAIMLLTDN
jgi:hypothetical protein